MRCKFILLVLLAILLISTCNTGFTAEGKIWQPMLVLQGADYDARLDKHITVEIIGRPVAVALKRLSAISGVVLSVAPEKLDILGERKVTLIARKLTLRAIMERLSTALPECYWRMLGKAGAAKYVLYWEATNYYSYTALRRLQQTAGRQAGQSQVRFKRVEELIETLGLSEAQFGKIEQQDPLLAQAARNPTNLAALNALLNLSPASLERFFREGELEISWSAAPASLREAARMVLEDLAALEQAQKADADSAPGSLKVEIEQRITELFKELPHSKLTFRDAGCERGLGIILSINGDGKTIIPPRQARSERWQQLLLAQLSPSGETGAFVPNMDWSHIPPSPNNAESSNSKKAAVEANLPQMGKMVWFSTATTLAFSEIQRRISQQTGLSIISDYFTLPPRQLPKALQEKTPLSRTLNLIRPERYEWQVFGELLVFHRIDWYDMSLKEVPEELLVKYHEKISRQGGFTLDDAAAFYRALRRRVPPILFSLPGDLADAGLAVHPRDQWALLLYGSLSQEQKAKTRGQAGLKRSEMTETQAAQVRELERLARGEALRPIAPDASLHLEITQAPFGKNMTQYTFVLAFPSGQALTSSIALTTPHGSARK